MYFLQVDIVLWSGSNVTKWQCQYGGIISSIGCENLHSTES